MRTHRTHAGAAHLVLAAALLAVASRAADAQGKVRHGSFPWASPDGTHIVFESNRTGTTQLYIMRLDGTDERQLTSLPSGAQIPVWSPDGQWILYQAMSGGPGGGGMPMARMLHAIQPDGSSDHAIVPLKMGGWPRLSGDGKRVAIVTPDSAGAPAITTMNLDGSDPRTIPTGGVSAWDPVLSPDGKTIVFGAMPSMTADPNTVSSTIYIADTSGAHRRELGTYPGYIQIPAWSPDGRTIAYMTFTGPKQDAHIVLLDVASGQFRVITHHDHPILDETPAWLPDGRLLIQSNRDGIYEVYVLNADGSGQRRLTR